MTDPGPAGGAHRRKLQSVKQRIEFGRRQRDSVPRTEHSQVRFKEREFDPIDVLLLATEGRLRQLLPIKYSKMAVSPFAFFRGAVAIMAADLARLPQSGIHVQLCGDAHVQNLGSFASPDGKLIFDLNDFDETIRGPWEWDVKRLAASIILGGRAAGQPRSERRAAAAALVESYCRAMNEFSRQPILVVARHFIHREKSVEPIHAALRCSERAKPLDLLKKYTVAAKSGERRFRDLRPVIWRVGGREAKSVLASLATYRKVLSPEKQHLFDLFRPIDVGFKIVGTGSVGLRDYIVLLEGNGPKDPLFLQIKQEVASAYAGYLPVPGYKHHGQRVAEGQRAIQPVSDLLLGWTDFDGHQYLVRQLNDHKGGIELQTLAGAGLENLALVAGELLARGHARSGDACVICGYCGGGAKIVKAITEFGSRYADQTEKDYARFMDAIQRGRITVSSDAASPAMRK